MADRPKNISEDQVVRWQRLGFDLRFLPVVDFFDENFLATMPDRPRPFFFRLIEEGRLPRSAAGFFGHWLLVDGRDKPEKSRWWISRDEVKILNFINRPIRYFMKSRPSSQIYHNDFLSAALKEIGAVSRFCLSIKDIESLCQSTSVALGVPSEAVRLPTFAEYNYLGNFFYPQWAKSKTWEWLNDQVGGGHLASGSGSVGCLGLDPNDYWSTILGFRFVVDLDLYGT